MKYHYHACFNNFNYYSFLFNESFYIILIVNYFIIFNIYDANNVDYYFCYLNLYYFHYYFLNFDYLNYVSRYIIHRIDIYFIKNFCIP